MPTKRVKTGVRNLTVLSHAQKSYLLSGRYLITADAPFEDDDEVDEAWQQHREKILAEWHAPGRRPPLFWDQDVRLGCVHWPDQWAWPAPYENEADLVRAMILAGELAGCSWDGNNRIESEVAEIDAEWRHTLRLAITKGHSTAAGVPKWFCDEHMPRLKVEVAPERSAWKRSIAQHIETPAPAG